MSEEKKPEQRPNLWGLLENTGLLNQPVSSNQTFRLNKKAAEAMQGEVDFDNWTLMSARPPLEFPDTVASRHGSMSAVDRSPLSRKGTSGLTAAPARSWVQPAPPDVPDTSVSSIQPAAHATPQAPPHPWNNNPGAPATPQTVNLSPSSDQMNALPPSPMAAVRRLTSDSLEAVPASALQELAATSQNGFLAQIPIARHPNDRTTDLLWQRKVGAGGAGEVSLATQRSLFRDVALKTILPDAKVPHPEDMLIQEGMITGHLEHPNIIPVHSLGYDDQQRPTLVMKYVEGVVWSELIHDDHHPFWNKRNLWSKDPLLRHLDILLEICQALEFAHEKGIIHRDIKPANVMLGAFGEVYLLDWGLALIFDKQSPLFRAIPSTAQDEEDDGFYGTPLYMAPEMLEGDEYMGRFTDVYLLGATLYEILNGRPPHQGQTVEDALLSVLERKQKYYHPTCPPELKHICETAMAFEASKRYPHVEAFRDAIVQFMQHRTSLNMSTDSQLQLQQLRTFMREKDDLTAADKRHMYRTFHSCRFGFVQALREWPENDKAQQGLEEAIDLMFQHECEQGHIDAAEALLDELDAPSLQNQRMLQEHRQRLTNAKQEQKQLQHLKRELDFTIAGAQRTYLMLVMGCMACIFAGVRFWLGQPVDLRSGYKRALLFVGITSMVLLVGLLLGRNTLFQNNANRRFILIVIMCCGTVTVHRAIRAIRMVPLNETYLYDLILLGCIVLTAAITLRAWLAFIAVLLLCGAALSRWQPHNTYHIMTICIAASWLLCGMFWGREGKQQTNSS